MILDTNEKAEAFVKAMEQSEPWVSKGHKVEDDPTIIQRIMEQNEKSRKEQGGEL